MQINCSTGNKVSLSSLEFYKPKIKIHSILMLEELKHLLITDGLLMPVIVQKVEDHIYIVDGEARVTCLLDLEGPNFEVPVVYCRGDIEKNIVMSCSTSHCLNKANLRLFADRCELDLKQYSFFEGELMDFHTVYDIDRYFEQVPVKKSEEIDYVGLLAGGII